VVSLRADDDRMSSVYALVIVCHALVIAALWLFGRVFST
jgi:hypothetical protein